MSHYGDEFYCTMTSIQVHGSPVMHMADELLTTTEGVSGAGAPVLCCGNYRLNSGN